LFSRHQFAPISISNQPEVPKLKPRMTRMTRINKSLEAKPNPEI
jgi:hypothetical protein